MSMTETGRPPAGKSGLIVTMAAVTLIAAAGGGIVGRLLSSRLAASQVPPAAAPAPKTTPAGAAASPAYPADVDVRELQPIVTNLAVPPTMHIRLQVAIAYSKKAVENPTMLSARIADDIVAFLKTLSLQQLQGASGLQNLREDLNERAATRSQGAVHEVIIETLVTQ